MSVLPTGDSLQLRSMRRNSLAKSASFSHIFGGGITEARLVCGRGPGPVSQPGTTGLLRCPSSALHKQGHGRVRL